MPRSKDEASMNLMEQQVEFVFGGCYGLAQKLTYLTFDMCTQAKEGYSQAGGVGELHVRAVEDFEQIIMRGAKCE